nr:hypothetical protein [Tanacetum cinerariifolium]
MMTNDLKASVDYLECLAKSTGHAHSEDVATAATPPRATSRGKGLLTKNKAVIAAEDATDTTVIATDSVVEVTKNDNAVTLTSKNVKMTDVEMVTDQQDLLFRMMDKAKTFKRHPKHKDLYDALAASLIVNEDDMDRVF